MRVSLNWLKDYVDLPADRTGLDDLLSRLEMAGLAIDTVERPWAGATKVAAGIVRSVTAHPAGGRLRVAEVDAGGGRMFTLVSGAANFGPGDVVPVVHAGGALPGGRGVEAAEFGGITSEGMMCSESELGLAVGPAAEAGIMILDPDIAPGTDLVPLLCLDDEVLDLDLPPNYAAYCQSMLGVAREVAALTGGELREPAAGLPEGTGGSPDGELLGPLSATSTRDFASGEAGRRASVVIKAPDLCSRYSGAVFSDLEDRPSPWWMQRRLIAAGVRPVNCAVDVTNYVMLELGQPLHAFDLDLVAGRRIVVRRAAAGERLVTLDGVERLLRPDDLLITDPAKAIAIAGVMGGGNSEISAATKHIFLESAHFAPAAVRRTSRRLGLRTEASSRFEKGRDPSATVLALERASELLVSLGAARRVGGVVDVVAKASPLRKIDLPAAYARTLTGVDLTAEEMVVLLDRLGIPARAGDGGARLSVSVPSHRPDIDGRADVVEEIARSYGYDRVPAELPSGPAPAATIPPRRKAALHAGAVLRGFGLTELVTFAYHSPAEFERLLLPAAHPWREAITLANPMNEDQSVLRRSLVPNFLRVLAYNADQGVADVGGYEVGRVYVPASLPLKELPKEPFRIGITVAGTRPGAAHWRGQDHPVDFYDLKGIIEGLAEAMAIGPLTFRRGTMPFTHPGRTALVGAAGRELGWLGELAAQAMQNYGLRRPAYVAELDFDAVFELAGGGTGFTGLPRYPAVQRDLAFVVPETVPAAEVKEVISGAGGDLLAGLRLFDVYRGEQIPAKHRSLAYALTFRSAQRTLSDTEVDDACRRIVEAVKSAGGVLRG